MTNMNQSIDDGYDEYNILFKERERKRVKIKNIKVDIDTHEQILWSAINEQSGAVKKIAADINVDAKIIKSSLQYWARKKLVVKHGRNGHKLIDNLKIKKINLNHSFLQSLQCKFGEFEFVSSDTNEQDGMDTDSECEFYKDVVTSPTELILRFLCIVFFVFHLVRSSLVIKLLLRLNKQTLFLREED